MIPTEELLNGLAYCTGTEQYWKLPGFLGSSMKYTDGVQYLAQNADCYWLLTAIASYQPELKSKHKRVYPFQLWELKVKEDHSAVLTCAEDSDIPPVITQAIEFTDFPLPEFKLWLVNGVLLLPSEY